VTQHSGSLKFKLAGGPRSFAFCLLSVFFPAGINAFAESVTSTNLSASIPAFSGALPDTSASVVRVFGALILVVGIFLGGVWLFKNWQRFTVQKGGGPKLNVLEVRSLGQRQSLYVVGYQQQRMLLASSPAGIALLSHLPAAEEAEAAEPVSRISFAEAFQQVVARKQ
jgi:flagellar biogenesis protein FliO